MDGERNLDESGFGTPKLELENVMCIEISDDDEDIKPMKRLTKTLRLEEYDEVFEREKIDLKILSEMDHTALKSIGVRPYGDRHRLLREAKDQMS